MPHLEKVGVQECTLNNIDPFQAEVNMTELAELGVVTGYSHQVPRARLGQGLVHEPT